MALLDPPTEAEVEAFIAACHPDGHFMMSPKLVPDALAAFLEHRREQAMEDPVAP